MTDEHLLTKCLNKLEETELVIFRPIEDITK